MKVLIIALMVCLASLTIIGKTFASMVVSGGFSDRETTTDNRLSASSLAFILTDQSDNQISGLFDISATQPGESQAKSFRIKKVGAEDFAYNFSFSKTSGEDAVCEALQIEAKLSGVSKYNGVLKNLSLAPAVAIGSSGTDDWEFTLKLADDLSSLADKTCAFNLRVKGWQAGGDGSWGFSDSHNLSNSVKVETVTGETLSTEVGPIEDILPVAPSDAELPVADTVETATPSAESVVASDSSESTPEPSSEQSASEGDASIIDPLT